MEFSEQDFNYNNKGINEDKHKIFAKRKINIEQWDIDVKVPGIDIKIPKVDADLRYMISGVITEKTFIFSLD